MREEIEAKKRPDLKRFAGVAQQLLEALQSLHDLTVTVLHNDIKPDNIILSDGDHPVLIDFGLASTPYTGTYEGSEGYVAPDLRSGQDREYSVSGDIYSMGVTLYEWLTGSLPTPYQDADEEAAGISAFPEGLKTWIRTAVATDTDLRFTSAHDMASELQKSLSAPAAPEPTPKYEEPLKPAATAERPFVPSLKVLSPNPFVAYLNSLHCRDAGNEKALAESQVTDPNFSYIQVPQPITQNVIDALTGKDKLHIILTGHAGDGKSTIAAEVYKSLMSIPLGEPLHEGLRQHEELNYKGKKIVIVKDFSELPDRIGLIKETLDTNLTRFFLVSNTGTLIDAFRRYEKSVGGDVLQVENDILAHIESNKTKTLNYHGSEFKIINMSLVNNLDLAEQIFRLMIAKERWEPCTKQECRITCPIFRNVSLIQANEEIVRERILLTYQRMNEYGQRLTLRQLCGHMAYMITAGLNYQDIQSMAQKADPQPHSNFMFFNRFFGDDGWSEDIPAGQISAVRAVREQGFGNHLCPSWERRLWMRSKALEFDFSVQGCQNEFTDLRENGNRQAGAAYATPSAARNQVRRILYFLHPFTGEPEGTFLKTFLNSAMILDFSLWQRQSGNQLSHLRGNLLRQKILHVLHEHFTGIRLPEGTANEGYLYITLSRRASDVRQSAQIVLTSVPATAFKLLLETVIDATGSKRKELVMTCQHNGTNLKLLLGLPFLDYVMMRNQGEIGQDLQASYVDRLERFKAQITKASADRDIDNIMLVRLRTNYTFKSQVYAVHNGKLEVTDG